ncbi:hypothetical protein P7K49_020734, partial [Saguinus oedipus]
MGSRRAARGFAATPVSGDRVTTTGDECSPRNTALTAGAEQRKPLRCRTGIASSRVEGENYNSQRPVRGVIPTLQGSDQGPPGGG